LLPARLTDLRRLHRWNGVAISVEAVMVRWVCRRTWTRAGTSEAVANIYAAR